MEPSYWPRPYSRRPSPHPAQPGRRVLVAMLQSAVRRSRPRRRGGDSALRREGGRPVPRAYDPSGPVERGLRQSPLSVTNCANSSPREDTSKVR